MMAEEYVRRGHRRVGGWLRPEAAILILALARQQSARGAVGEIGVYHGKLFILLSLLRREGERAVAVDLFEHQELNVDRSGEGDQVAFERNLEAAGAGDDVTVRAVDSTTVTSADLLGWAGGPFRLFSVDGGHTAEITQSDLTNAAECLGDGGLLILDDYFNVTWPGVSEGTNRFLATGPSVVPVGSAHGKMFFSSPEVADEYRRTMRQVAATLGWHAAEQPFHGQPHTILRTESPTKHAIWTAKRVLKRIPGARSVAAAIR